MKISVVPAKSLLVKSKLPASDYVANPYSGCPHKCGYCYASFMKRFSSHPEPWGEYLDVKECESDKLPRDLRGKTVLLSSVTDPYNAFEKKYKKTQALLKKLALTDANVEILTKSALVTRDIDLFKAMPRIKIGMSLNTLDDGFRRDIEPRASSVGQRISALKTLHENGISTYLFISPIFPYITDTEELCAAAAPFVDEICFENLNLKGERKAELLKYIAAKYPRFSEEYKKIYNNGDMTYWTGLENEIAAMGERFSIPLISYFYHDKIKKNGGDKKRSNLWEKLLRRRL